MAKLTVEMRKYVSRITFVVTLALIPLVAAAAIIDDGNDRRLVVDLLRDSPPSTSLSDDLRAAIVRAADSIGMIVTCGRYRATGFFARVDGRPAFLTSGHVVARDFGLHMCEGLKDQSVRIYASLSGQINRQKQIEFVTEQGNPELHAFRNTPGFGTGKTVVGAGAVQMGRNADLAIFFLTTDQPEIPLLQLSDQTFRGRYSVTLDKSHNDVVFNDLHLISLATDVGEYSHIIYQSECYNSAPDIGVFNIYHTCDSLPGTSGAVLGVYESGEIRVLGVNNFMKEADGLHVPAPGRLDWTEFANGGLSADGIREIANLPRPKLLSYDVQWLLHRAGCYSGKLDNQWGPGSRKALATFAAAVGTELPGTEPSPELLAAVEKAAPDGAEVCR